jgi:hypothetical protein
MRLFFSNKAVRLLLSISVSIWMAGACLFGCTNTAKAADTTVHAVKAGMSCHAAHSAPAQKDGATFAPTPRGTMQDCPLVTNATAATSKNSTYVPDPGQLLVAVLPQLQKQTQLVNRTLVVSFLPNRGPTHLLCCVFLI